MDFFIFPPLSEKWIPTDCGALRRMPFGYQYTIFFAGMQGVREIMPVLMSHYVMLQRNLIYTGITRAKKVMVVVGTKKAIAYSVNNVTVTKRNTMLAERLKSPQSAFSA